MNMRSILTELRISLLATLCLAVLLCGVYPMVVWGLAQGIFHREANGSLVVKGGRTVGSSLLAQGFASAKYFHPRPSAAGSGYDAASSGGSNLGPLSKKLIDDTAQRVRDYRTENNLAPDVRIPADAVSASGSGLDPHISPENAFLQAPRVARARGLSEEAIIGKIKAHAEGRTLGIFGEPRVNVLLLNLDLDGSP
ncbi:MAG TPA: K(+)-transporting ATPase subunit C [Syntrophales bacterium]|nr:K(+)-transporting ATPase subunit C [Syntrophales bacterium]